MSNIKIYPSKIHGEVTAPPSKSDVHRAIICAALAKGESVISPVAFSQDILATIDCIKALGADVTVNENSVVINGKNIFCNKNCVLDCRESGSTVRFFIPVAAAGGVSAEFIGKGRLPQRPLGVYSELLPQHGIQCKTEGGLPFSISGNLKSGVFNVPGNISSQFITGLLFALPILEGDSVIHITSELQSKGYIDMTIDVQKKFGVEISYQNGDFYIKGNQSYKPCSYTTEGDWSQAAFFLVGAAICGEIAVNGLRMDSRQGDKAIADILKKVGADIYIEQNTVYCKANQLNGINIDASQIPDLVPILSVLGAYSKGEILIYNAQRVRLKESDRLSAMTNALSACGADIKQTEDSLIICGKDTISGGFAEGCNDHRIVMSMAIAALKSEIGITISDKESITKSYDNFFEDLDKVRGE